METVLQTQQLKNHDDFCALNQDLPTIRPIKNLVLSRHFYLCQMLSTKISIMQTKSISALPLAYKLLLLLQDCQ